VRDFLPTEISEKAIAGSVRADCRPGVEEILRAKSALRMTGVRVYAQRFERCYGENNFWNPVFNRVMRNGE
jgi:hypothetical protein